MISSRSFQKEIVRLRTRASYCEATNINTVNMRRTTRQTPVAQGPTVEQSNETDLDSVNMHSPLRSSSLLGTFSNDSEKLDFLCHVKMLKVASLTQEIKELKRQNAEKDKHIKTLENRLDDLEQYSRQDNIIITGFNYKHLSYSRAATPDQETHNHENSSENEKASLENQVVELFENYDIPIDKSCISACHHYSK